MLKTKNAQNEKLAGSKNDSDIQLVELGSKLMLKDGEIASAQETEALLRRELAASKDEIKKKVNQLTQVTNMKKMIVDKNNQLKAVRERLGKYENLDDD